MPSTQPFPDSLCKIPSSSTIHYWADFTELLCLVNVDGEISEADLIARTRRIAHDLKEGDEKFQSIKDSSAQDKDRWNNRARDIFSHLKYRKNCLGDYYPFDLSSNSETLQLKDTISERNCLYLFLLFASNLGYLDQARQILTNEFQEISKATLEHLLPEWAKVYVFGPSGNSDQRYRGPLWEKIKLLSEDIRGKLLVEESFFSRKNVGDAGLDIVGWIPIPDPQPSLAPGIPIFFGQCACTDKWVEKQHSSSSDTWSSLIHTIHRTSNFAFIPFFFRNIDGGWQDYTKIHSSILIDRFRIIFLLKDSYNLNEDASSLLQDLISRKEEIY